MPRSAYVFVPGATVLTLDVASPEAMQTDNACHPCTPWPALTRLSLPTSGATFPGAVLRQTRHTLWVAPLTGHVWRLNSKSPQMNPQAPNFQIIIKVAPWSRKVSFIKIIEVTLNKQRIDNKLSFFSGAWSFLSGGHRGRTYWKVPACLDSDKSVSHMGFSLGRPPDSPGKSDFASTVTGWHLTLWTKPHRVQGWSLSEFWNVTAGLGNQTANEKVDGKGPSWLTWTQIILGELCPQMAIVYTWAS